VSARTRNFPLYAAPFVLAGGFVERWIAHQHFAERPEVRIETWWRRESVTPADAQQSGVMRLLHQYAMTRGLLMACDESILVEDLAMASTLVDTDYQSHVFDRH
jgi:hypothetical protein